MCLTVSVPVWKTQCVLKCSNKIACSSAISSVLMASLNKTDLGYFFFSKEGFEKTLWTANRRPACEWWKKIPSTSRTNRDSHCAGCFELALWLPGHLAHSLIPQRPSLCTTKCKCHLKGLCNPGVVKHFVLDLPSAAMTGMRFFLQICRPNKSRDLQFSFTKGLKFF